MLNASPRRIARRELDALKDARSSLEPLAAGVADAKQELIGEFERWLAASGAAAFAGTGVRGATFRNPSSSIAQQLGTCFLCVAGTHR